MLLLPPGHGSFGACGPMGQSPVSGGLPAAKGLWSCFSALPTAPFQKACRGCAGGWSPGGMLRLYWKGGEPGVSLSSRAVPPGGISGASESKEVSANACHSLGTGFLCKLSILLFSFLILICMLPGRHVYI